MNLQQAKTLRAYVRRQLAPLYRTEGSSSPEEMMYLANSVGPTDIHLVGEIGMNIGYSAHSFLSERVNIRVVSFDLGMHEYIDRAKALIDEMYPTRHELIKGNSLETIPEFAAGWPTVKFDFFFIDGSHSYKMAKADLHNVKDIVKPGATIVMDDVTPYRSYGRNPYKVWNEARRDGFIQHIEFVEDGKVVDVPTQAGTHVWATGYYK